MYVRFKSCDDFEHVSKNVLMEFLKQNTDKNGKLSKHLEVRQFVPFNKNEDGSFSWIFSDESVDRECEKIAQDGWDLKNYLKNPVVLWGHNASIPAIGYAKNVGVKGNLCGDIVFNDKEFDPFGWSIGERVKFGSIRAGSVGFLVKEIDFVDHTKTPTEKADIIYRKQELLEFSICNVPCNPNATVAEIGEKTITDYNFFKSFLTKDKD